MDNVKIEENFKKLFKKEHFANEEVYKEVLEFACDTAYHVYHNGIAQGAREAVKTIKSEFNL